MKKRRFRFNRLRGIFNLIIIILLLLIDLAIIRVFEIDLNSLNLPNRIETYKSKVQSSINRKNQLNYLNGISSSLEDIEYRLSSINTGIVSEVLAEDIVGYLGMITRDSSMDIQELTFGLEDETGKFKGTAGNDYYLLKCAIYGRDSSNLEYFLYLLERIKFKYSNFEFEITDSGTVFNFIIDMR